MAVIPKKATTIILLRERESEGFEVFLLRRHEKSSFMGGNYVYPGGRLDPEDCLPEIWPFCRGLSSEEAHRIFGGTISKEESLGHWIAGIRELFEEAGVLLAYDQKGNFLRIENPEKESQFLYYRHLLNEGKITLFQLIREQKLLLALDQIHYYAHWITPEARSERFDTRFLIARHPEGQEADHDRKETTVGVWMTPRQALQENLTGEVALSPPAVKTLEDLSRFKNIDEVFDSLKEKQIQPILPILTKISDETFILFPWDPQYPLFQQGIVPYPVEHGLPSGPADQTTRLVLIKGHWHPYSRKE